MVRQFNKRSRLTGSMRHRWLMTAGFAATLLVSSVTRGGSIFDDDFVSTAPTKPVPKTPDPVTPNPGTKTEPTTPDNHAINKPVEPPTGVTVTSARKTIPVAAEQAKSRKLFLELFAKELDDRNPVARRSLAAKLLEQSAAVSDAPADQFVLLVGATHAAVEGSDLDLCCRAADALATSYEVDGLRLKCDTAMKMKLRAETTTATDNNCRAALRVVDDAVASSDYATASRLLQMLRPLAPSGELASEIQSRTKQVEMLRAATERIVPAMKKLESSPDDAPANLAVGEYLCFIKNNWESGLPLLAKGGNKALSAAVALDQAGPTDPEKQVEAGDAWWAVAEKETGSAQLSIRQRSALWYGKALDSGAIPGLRRLTLEKRLAAAQPTPGSGGSSRALPKVTVVSAEYGAGKTIVSVAKVIQADLDADPLAPVMASKDHFKVDPVPLVKKKLVLSYRAGGTLSTIELAETEIAIVPPIPKEGLAIPGASIPFKIIVARYGTDLIWLNVTDEIRNEIKDPSVPYKTHNMADGHDLHDKWWKYIVVYFEVNGRRFVRLVPDGDSMTLIPK